MLEYIGLTDKKIIEDAINQILEWYTVLNHSMDEPLPKIKFNKKEKIIESTIDRDKIWGEMGVVFTEEYFKNMYNLTEDDSKLIKSAND